MQHYIDPTGDYRDEKPRDALLIETILRSKILTDRLYLQAHTLVSPEQISIDRH